MERVQSLITLITLLESLGPDRRRQAALHDFFGIFSTSTIFIGHLESLSKKENSEPDSEPVGKELGDLVDSLRALFREKVDPNSLMEIFEEKQKLFGSTLSALNQFEADPKLSRRLKEFPFLIRMSRFLFGGEPKMLACGLKMLALSTAFLLDPNDELLKELEKFRFNLNQIVNIFVNNSEIPESVKVNWAGTLIFLNLLRNARQAASSLGDPEAITVSYSVEEGVNVVKIENKSKEGLPEGYGKGLIEGRDRVHYGGFLVTQIFPLFAKMYVGKGEGKEVEVNFESKEEGGEYVINSIVRTKGNVFQDK